MLAGRRRADHHRTGPRRAAAMLLAGVMVGLMFPSASPAQQQPDLAAALRAQVAAEGGLPWSAGHPPTWPDFQGRPERGTPTAAQTASSVSYVLQCNGPRLSFAVLAVFSRPESWVRPDIPGNRAASQRTLQHERTHFDISEIFARRLRQALFAAPSICPGGRGEARRLFDELSAASTRQQATYDRETAHGMAADAQDRWDRAIGLSLDSLRAFAAPLAGE